MKRTLPEMIAELEADLAAMPELRRRLGLPFGIEEAKAGATPAQSYVEVLEKSADADKPTTN